MQDESEMCMHAGPEQGTVQQDVILGEYVTWTFSPNNNGIAHQGRAG
jgi:hypothetical protein